MKRSALIFAFVLSLAITLFAQREQPAQRHASLSTLIRNFQTISVHSKTGFIKDDMLIAALQKHKDFDDWDIGITTGEADVVLEADHTPMTFIYNWKMTHRLTGMVLGAGKMHAISGPDAADKIADAVVQRIAKYRNTKPDEQQKKPPEL